MNSFNTCGDGTTESNLKNHKITNALTIDVEDYFHIHAFANTINPADWDLLESIVEKKTYHILDLLDSATPPKPLAANHHPGCSCRPPRATFFILGWVAERYPGLVKEICTRGHEVACHGYAHKCIFNQTPKEFREDVRKAKAILEDLTGTEVIGYRAPTYSITRETLWALSILFELGFQYDSSIFPIRHDFYGLPEAPRFPFRIDFSSGDLVSQFKQPKYLNGAGTSRKYTGSGGCRRPDGLVNNSEPADTITSEPSGPKTHCNTIPPSLYPQSDSNSHFVEFPLSTVSLLGRNLPCSGGGVLSAISISVYKVGI